MNGSLTPEALEAAFHAGLDAAREWGSPVYRAHIAADLGQWLRDRGRDQEAAEFLEEAREIYRRLDAHGWQEALDGRP
jgi:hypothetical protein